MEIISLVVAIIALVLAHSAKNRVVLLENSIKNIHTAQAGELTPATTSRANERLGEPMQAIPPDLLSYIKKQIDAGVSRENILSALLQNGWEKSVAEMSLSRVGAEPLGVQGQPASIWLTMETKPNAILEWIKEDWLMKLGALLFIIGIGWFVTYAFMNNWVGPQGRIVLGMLTGTIILALGTWRMGNHKNQGAVLVAVGAAIVTITTIAARELYGYFTPISELGIIFLVSAFAAFASVRYKSPSLAALSIVLGHSAPIFVGGISDVLFAFIYLFIVAISTLWVAAFTGWRFLAGTSLAFFAWYSFTGGIPDNIAILFLFATLYFAANVAAMIKSEKPATSDVLTAGGLAIMLVFWILDIVPDVWQSLATAGWTVLFTVAAFVAFKMSNRKEPLLIYSTIAIGLLGAATAMELSGPTLALAYTLEIAALAFATAFVTGNMKYAQQTSVLLAVPLALSLFSINSSAWQTGVLHDDFFVLFSLSAVLLVLGAFFLGKKNVPQDAPTKNGIAVSLTLGAAYALILIWLSLHASFDREIATTIALVIYTILGMAAYIVGKMRDMHTLFVSGGVLLGAVVLRLLFVEAWRLDMAGRIVVFLIVGALLVTTAFIGRSRGQKQG